MPGYFDPRFITNNVFTSKKSNALVPDKNTAALQTSGSIPQDVKIRLSSTALTAPIAKNLNIPSQLIYPKYLTDEKYANRPLIELCCLDARPQFGINANTKIYLPAPALSLANNSMYDDSPLGIKGAAAIEMADTLKQNDLAGTIDSIKNKSNSAFENAINSGSFTSGGIKAGALIGASQGLSALGLDEAAKAVKIGSRALINSNVVTEFTATATREYELQFKFIPDSREEAIEINNIVKLLKISVYPAVTASVLLEYPPRWTIKFLSGIGSKLNGNYNGGDEIQGIAKLYSCYLMSCNISYNDEAVAFFEDGNPLQTSISLNFKETRALNANDISNL